MKQANDCSMSFNELCDSGHCSNEERIKLAELLAAMRYKKTLDLASPNQADLECWAQRAVQELQDFCDDAQQAAGNPKGEDQLPGTRALITEFDAIANGRPSWQAQIGPLTNTPISL